MKVRYRAAEAPAVIEPLDGRCVRVRFSQPQRAIASGQAVVFYDSECCLGGGWIDAVGEAHEDDVR